MKRAKSNFTCRSACSCQTHVRSLHPSNCTDCTNCTDHRPCACGSLGHVRSLFQHLVICNIRCGHMCWVKFRVGLANKVGFAAQPQSTQHRRTDRHDSTLAVFRKECDIGQILKDFAAPTLPGCACSVANQGTGSFPSRCQHSVRRWSLRHDERWLRALAR